MSKDDYPVAILFQQDKEHIRFTGKFTAESLKAFIRRHAGVYLPLVGCTEEFDRLVEELMVAEGKEVRQEVVRRAEELWDKAEGKVSQRRAAVYVKIMRKVVEIGEGFVKTESARVRKILGGKVTKEKKEELEERINILKSFGGVETDEPSKEKPKKEEPSKEDL